MMKNIFISVLILTFLLLSCNKQVETKQIENTLDIGETQDPLPSWNASKSKQDIIEFVEAITDSTGTDFIAPIDRIVTFDNDGTLWAEQPAYFQLFFAIDRIKAMASQHPEWQKDTLLKAVLDNDMQTLMASGEAGLIKIIMITHAGMTTAEFEEIVKVWIAAARHPQTGKLFKEMTYQPMLEVINYLKANQCKVFIVSGGGIEFMRPWTQEVYGIPAEQVIGSSIKVKLEIQDSIPVLVRQPEINFIDDKEGKISGIHYYIGKRPIASFGNSDGDLAMLQWANAGKNRSLKVFIHHTDEKREFAYDKESHIGKLDKGLEEGKAKNWTIVDMKADWKNIFFYEN